MTVLHRRVVNGSVFTIDFKALLNSSGTLLKVQLDNYNGLCDSTLVCIV